MSKNKMLGNQVVVTKNNDGEVNGKMENKKVDMEKVKQELKNSKPYAFRVPVALRLALDRVTNNASEYVCQLLLADDKIKSVFLEIVEKGYDVGNKKERTNIDNLIKLI